MSDKFTCAMCHQTFTKGWTDSKAESELEEQFPGFETDDCDQVCDDCYKAMGFGQ